MLRRLRLQIDPYLFVCLALGLLLFWPLLARGLPQAPDIVLHYYRAALWRWAWNDGALWPRWDTLLFQGYGYPALSFNGPLAYILTALASLALPGVLAGYKAMLLLACLAYPIGMYLWAREVLGPLPGLVAAAAYTFATIRFRELYFVGGAAQFLAWSLYPWTLYAFLRLARAPSRGIFLLAVFSLAAVVLAHNIAAMLFAPVLLVYVLYLLIAQRDARAGGWLVAAGALAVLVSAVFWLPALAELRFARAQVLTQGHWDVRVHFIRLRDFFAAALPLDARAVNPPVPFNYGPLHLPLAALGFSTIFLPRQARGRRGHLLLAAGCVLFASFMMLPESYPVWRIAGPLRYAEYPWRIFGVALLGVSLLAGAAMDWLRRWPLAQRGAALLLILAVPISLMVYQFPRPFYQVDESPAGFLAYETAFRALGTTAGNEFLGPWVTQAPETPAVTADGTRRGLFDPPPGVSAVVEEARTAALRLRVTAERAGPVQVAQFFFPGWRATVDGRATDVRPAAGSGMIELDVPAGTSEVRLAFGDTPLRTAAALMSLAGLLATAILAVALSRPRPARVARGDLAFALIAGGGVVALLALTVAWIGPRTSWFRLASPPGRALPAAQQLDQRGDLVHSESERAGAHVVAPQRQHHDPGLVVPRRPQRAPASSGVEEDRPLRRERVHGLHPPIMRRVPERVHRFARRPARDGHGK